MRLVMTLKVRDEEDVIEDNLRFHRALGVDFFVVMDNGSVDRTPEILARYADAGLAHVLRDETGDLRGPGGPVVHADGPVGGDGVRSRLGDPQRRRRVLVAASRARSRRRWPRSRRASARWSPRARSSSAGRRAPSSFAERLVFRERRSALQPKVAHRADPDVVVLHRGAHEVAAASDGDLWRALRPPGRAVHRSVRDAEDEPQGDQEDIRLVWAPIWPLRIFHFPLRSFEQFRRRTEISLHQGGFRDSGRFRRLRWHYEQERLEELYAELIWDDAAIDEGIREGKLVRDERIAELLPRCPDPLDRRSPGRVAHRARPGGARGRAPGGAARRDAAADPNPALHDASPQQEPQANRQAARHERAPAKEARPHPGPPPFEGPATPASSIRPARERTGTRAVH